VQKWLKLAERHYGVKPIIYTSRNFYRYVLKGHVDGYTLWIADYNGKNKPHYIKDWHFHQFTDRLRINGIPHDVDGNNFNGRLKELKRLCI
jgi:lysozyme